MSMIGHFRQVSPGALERPRATPALVREVVLSSAASGEPALPPMLQQVWANIPEETRATIRAGLRRQQEAQLGGSERLRSAGITPQDLPEALTIEKAWHGLHFLLCGDASATASPLGAAVLGGRELGNDLGYGPARYLLPDEVASVAAALEGLAEAQLAARYDGQAMDRAGIYPGGWVSATDQNRAWLLKAFADLRDYYVQARQRGASMLLYLT